VYVNGNAKTQTADECGGNNDRSCSKCFFLRVGDEQGEGGNNIKERMKGNSDRQGRRSLVDALVLVRLFVYLVCL
jgi:hypothetical protein